MGPIKNERARRWLWAGSWAGLIYVTLYSVRPVCDFLKQYNIL
jgi:hypothetical protein